MALASLRKLKVLLVEDGEDDAILITRALTKLGYCERLVQLPDGDRVIPYLRHEGEYADRELYPAPDLLLMDNRMPRLRGLDVLFWIRTEPTFVRLPVVIVSGGLIPPELDMVRELKAAHFLKTVEFQPVAAALERAIYNAFEITGSPWSSHQSN